MKKHRGLTILARILAGGYGLVNSSAYSRSAYNSLDRFGAPFALKWGFIGIFSLFLTTAIASGYSKSIVAVAEKSSCIGSGGEDKGLLDDVSVGSDSVQASNKTSRFVAVSEWGGAVGKAIISNTSMWRFLNREIGRWTKVGDADFWIPWIPILVTVPSTFISQFAVLKNGELRGNSWLKSKIPDHSLAMARLANAPGIFMYFDTARKLMLSAGILTEEYGPSYYILFLSLFSCSLLIGGTNKFQVSIEKLIGVDNYNSVESIVCNIKKWNGGILVNIASALMKSFTGELALVLFLKDLTEKKYSEKTAESLFYGTLALTLIPVLVTMVCYFVVATGGQSASAKKAMQSAERTDEAVAVSREGRGGRNRGETADGTELAPSRSSDVDGDGWAPFVDEENGGLGFGN